MYRGSEVHKKNHFRTYLRKEKNKTKKNKKAAKIIPKHDRKPKKPHNIQYIN